MFKFVSEALEALGDEARAAFASEDPESRWEWTPEHAGDDPVWYDWCDDCETFHINHYPIGYEVTPGCVEMVVWNCDQDGNWDVVEGACIGTPDAEYLMKVYGHEAWEESYANYLRHVAETGKDPCGEFAPPPSKKLKERWRVFVQEDGGGLRVYQCSQEQDGDTNKPPIYPGNSDFPGYLREFLLLRERRGGWFIEGVKSTDELGDVEWVPGSFPGQKSALIEVEHSVSSVTDEEWSSMLREKANQARARIAFDQP